MFDYDEDYAGSLEYSEADAKQDWWDSLTEEQQERLIELHHMYNGDYDVD